MKHADLHPQDGARYLLELESEQDGRARYRASIFTPDQRFDYDVALEPPSTVEVSPRQRSAEPALESFLVTLATTTARAAKTRAEDGQTPFPPRILRWRGPR